MPTTVVVSRDPGLRQRVESVARTRSIDVTWVEDESMLESAFGLQPWRVLVDLNVPWSGDVVHCIERCRAAHEGVVIIAFLHEFAGERAIRARIAGANRVIPQRQLENELEEILADVT